MAPIKFYILPDLSSISEGDISGDAHPASPLMFVCRLAQKVISSGNQRLVIVDNQVDRLIALNDKLWEFSPTSFIAHELFIDKTLLSKEQAFVADVGSTDSKVKHSDLELITDYAVDNIGLQDLTAPVTLVNSLPSGFNGIVINLSTTAQQPPELEQIAQLLEVIASDISSIEKGREKVHYYRGLNAQVEFFKI